MWSIFYIHLWILQWHNNIVSIAVNNCGLLGEVQRRTEEGNPAVLLWFHFKKFYLWCLKVPYSIKVYMSTAVLILWEYQTISPQRNTHSLYCSQAIKTGTWCYNKANMTFSQKAQSSTYLDWTHHSTLQCPVREWWNQALRASVEPAFKSLL